MPISHDQQVRALVLLALTIFNVLLMVGLYPNAIPVIPTSMLFVLAAVEIAVIFAIFQASKRQVVQLPN